MIETIRRAWRDARTRTDVCLLEILAVAFAVMAIQVVMFHGYYLGSTSPGGDFLGLYSNEPFAWWRDGGLLHPPAWMPYLWGGYPSVASIQSSSWYLPTGAATLLGFDIHASAALQAFHVALAGVGVYVLGRRAHFGRVASLFGLVAYSFSTGFFSNAPYVDIVHGHALAPWLLLCLSPLWPWKRPWAVPVAAVIFWQAAVGVYPGMLTAFAYAGGAWAIAWQIGARPRARRFALPLLTAGVIAALVSMPKYLPLLELRTFQPGDVEDLSVLTRSSLGTFLLPGYSQLPGVYSMNSFFVPAMALLIAMFASFRSVAVRAAIASVVVTVLIAVPHIPGRDLVDMLPGVGSSRFRLNDFRPFVILPIVIAAMSGLMRLRSTSHRWLRPSLFRLRLAGALVLPLAAGVFIWAGKFDEGNWRPTAVVLGLSTLAVVATAQLSSRGRLVGFVGVAAPVLVISLTAASGYAYARTVVDIWDVDTVAAQQSLWGATSTELMQQRVDTSSVTQRPARSGIPAGAGPASYIGTAYNSAFYTGLPSVGGYLNVHMSASFVEARKALENPSTAEAERALLAAPGIVIGSSGVLPNADQVKLCVDDHACNGVTSMPLSYSPGALLYDVTASAPTAVLVNEAYYLGWSALLVDANGHATAVEPNLGPGGVISINVPAGVWRLSLTYRTPLGSVANALAGAGVVLAALVVILGARSRRSIGRPAAL
jgi:hypothetical protein